MPIVYVPRAAGTCDAIEHLAREAVPNARAIRVMPSIALQTALVEVRMPRYYWLALGFAHALVRHRLRDRLIGAMPIGIGLAVSVR